MTDTDTITEIIAEPSASQKNALYILGAGFSAAAGLPLANELWHEVLSRALPTGGREGKFRADLNDYIEFKERTEGVRLRHESVNFEEFLGFLDVEHYLGLRGSDTWSEDGNESQVIVKTLIGQILSERMPDIDKIPQLYIDFANKLKPFDRIITFNYDILLERALEAAGKPYRLAPSRYSSSASRPTTFDPSSYEEVAVLKLHGSIDWFDRGPFRRLQEQAARDGFSEHIPSDYIFHPSQPFSTTPIVAGPRHEDDPLREVHRVAEIRQVYSNPLT